MRETDPMRVLADPSLLDTYHDERQPIDSGNDGSLELRDLLRAQNIARQTQRKKLVADQCVVRLAVVFCDVRGGTFGFRRVVLAVATDGEELLLYARDGTAARHCRHGFRIDGARWHRNRLYRTDADGTDAVLPIAQQQSEIVLLFHPSGASLLFAKPAFGTQVLEERVQTGRPCVFPLPQRERTGDHLDRVRVIDKSRAALWSLVEHSNRLILEMDIRATLGH